VRLSRIDSLVKCQLFERMRSRQSLVFQVGKSVTVHGPGPFETMDELVESMNRLPAVRLGGLPGFRLMAAIRRWPQILPGFGQTVRVSGRDGPRIPLMGLEECLCMTSPFRDGWSSPRIGRPWGQTLKMMFASEGPRGRGFRCVSARRAAEERQQDRIGLLAPSSSE
jgi:hypothetical protein